MTLISLLQLGCASNHYSLPKDATITVDYNKSLTTMVEECSLDNNWGHCGARDLAKWCAENKVTSQYFPMRQDGHRETLAVELVDHIDIVTALTMNRRRRATLAELLAFGTKYPHVQCAGKIVATKQMPTIGDQRMVPVLYAQKRRGPHDAKEIHGLLEPERLDRLLDLVPFSTDFPTGTKFLVVTEQ